MPGKFALIVGNSHYDDSSLGRLAVPDVDVNALAGVLQDTEVGHFDEITTLLNEDCTSIRKAVARFYDQRQRDDLLFLYFSGHGVKDEQGHLYLAVRDTESRLLAGSAIEAAFIAGRMDRSVSRRLVLVLDCCYSGVFPYGAKAAQGLSVGTGEAFEGTGLGRVILTATDSMQYAWDGSQIIGDAQRSLFTHFLIDGLKTGAADRDDDGVVTVDELYDHVHEQVVNSTPQQTPHKWTYRGDGEIVLARNPFVKRSTLRPEIQEAISSQLPRLRLEAVRDLETLLRANHIGRARAALAALKDLSSDDSRKVANAAANVLNVYNEEKRGGVVGPHLSEPAIERKSLEPAPGSPRRLDPEAEGLAEPARAPEEGHKEPPGRTDGRVDGLASDIFISYAHEDREKARALANVLRARGWRVWWDRKIVPGEAFDVAIERELGTSTCVIVLWSARSVHATWVRNEARRAARRNVLVPILIDPVETPLEFENLQAADLTSWQGTAEHPELEAVLDRIQGLSPIPHDRLARSVVEDARREFAAGGRDVALAGLEQFRPPHDPVTRAPDLRAEAKRIEHERAEALRPEAEAAQRPREHGTETAGSKEPPESAARPRRRVDENVQFSVYRPTVVAPERWYPMLAFAHLAERRPDAAVDEPDPVEEVQRQAQRILGDDAAEFDRISQDSRQPIPIEGHLRIVPTIPGVEFNPPERSFLWLEPVHREAFQLRAGLDMNGRTARGSVSVYLDWLLIADIAVAMSVDSRARQEEPVPAHDVAHPYRRIFASYSHRDAAVVGQFEEYAQGFGDRYMTDVIDLRAGEVWDNRLAELIESADVFQLFWSWHSMSSPFVRSEWEHALTLNRPYFIRPVYWEQPFPERGDLPPAALRTLHFAHVGPLLSVPTPANSPSPVPAAPTSAESLRSAWWLPSMLICSAIVLALIVMRSC